MWNLLKNRKNTLRLNLQIVHFYLQTNQIHEMGKWCFLLWYLVRKHNFFKACFLCSDGYVQKCNYWKCSYETLDSWDFLKNVKNLHSIYFIVTHISYFTIINEYNIICNFITGILNYLVSYNIEIQIWNL